MRRFFLIVCIGILAVAATGCQAVRLRLQLRELMRSTIVLPERVTCVSEGEVYPMPEALRERPKLIVYVDTSACTPCRISHIEIYHELFRMAEESGLFEMMLLLSDVDLSGISLTVYLSDIGIEHPVYVDADNAFLALNPAVPDDSRMHAFLVDSGGHPVCVGDPTDSEELFRLFAGKLETLQGKE